MKKQENFIKPKGKELSGMLHVISFLLGALVSWGAYIHSNEKTLEVWQVAYSIGRDDGYKQGRFVDKSWDDWSRDEIDAKCMFHQFE